jgi:hypothetical protein
MNKPPSFVGEVIIPTILMSLLGIGCMLLILVALPSCNIQVTSSPQKDKVEEVWRDLIPVGATKVERHAVSENTKNQVEWIKFDLDGKTYMLVYRPGVYDDFSITQVQ